MKAVRLTAVGLILIAVVAIGHRVLAEQYVIEGNGAGSNNQLDINQNQNTTIQQNSNSSFKNDINAGANTGGNEGGSVTTGNASVKVTVKNQGNTNQANVDQCCPTKTPTPTPGKAGQPSPTPTSGVGGGAPPADGGGDGGAGGNGGGGGGGGQVIGLSAASGENYSEIAITATGIVCLLAGAYLTRKHHLAI